MEDRKTQVERVIRVVVGHLEGRGKPPNGWTTEAITQDYLTILGPVPEHALMAGFNEVMANRRFSTWPMASEIAAACRKHYLTGDDLPPSERRSTVDPRIGVTVRAWEYVRARMTADNGALILRCLMLGPWAKLEIERHLFGVACAALRDGREPYLSNADLGAFVETIRTDLEARTASQLALAADRKPGRSGLRPIHHRNPATNPDPQPRQLVEVPEEPPPVYSEDDYGPVIEHEPEEEMVL